MAYIMPRAQDVPNFDLLGWPDMTTLNRQYTASFDKDDNFVYHQDDARRSFEKFKDKVLRVASKTKGGSFNTYLNDPERTTGFSSHSQRILNQQVDLCEDGSFSYEVSLVHGIKVRYRVFSYGFGYIESTTVFQRIPLS